MKLYLDDLRNPEGDWIIFRDPISFFTFLVNNEEKVDEISLDHDLGFFSESEGKEITGYDVLCKIEEHWFGRKVSFHIKVHSANPVGVQRMLSVINNLKD